jgi:hypothetical protein
LTVLVATVALAACANPARLLPGSPTTASLSVAGNYEAIAGCVAEAGEKTAGGGTPELRVDRKRQRATVRRVLQPSNEVRYDISFVQTGASNVQVDGKATPGSREGAAAFAFLWPQVSQCATHLMSP